jgi:hypothetical protein
MVESLLDIRLQFCQFMEPETMQAVVCRLKAEATAEKESRV